MNAALKSVFLGTKPKRTVVFNQSAAPESYFIALPDALEFWRLTVRLGFVPRKTGFSAAFTFQGFGIVGRLTACYRPFRFRAKEN